MKDEEYAADFCLIAQRSLSLRQHRLFRFHYLLGADWKLCCPKLQMNRGEFFHECYRIEQKLGQVFRELQPYPLFPLDEYFRATPRLTRYERSLGAAEDLSLQSTVRLFSRLGRPPASDYLEDVGSETLANYHRGSQRAEGFPLKRKRKPKPNSSAATERSGD